MKAIYAKSLIRLPLIVTAALLVNGMSLQRVHTQEVDLNTLCHKFPLNSRCKGHVSPAQVEDTATENQASQADEIIKLKLKSLGGSDNEWLRIEVSENTVKLLHTTRAKTRISQAVNGVLGAVSPIPLPNINSHQWHDHPPTRVAFEPDKCSLVQHLKLLKNSAPQTNKTSGSPDCTLTGTDTVTLPQGLDIRSGRFTIEYKEGDLLRSITFRIPTEDS